MSKSRFSLPPLFALLVLSAPLSAIGQTFVQDAERHAVANSGLFSTNFAWSDYDLDGDLDLYVTNWETVSSIPANALFSNNGDSTFTDVAAQAGVANTGNSVAAAWGDYDSDGDPDLYVADFFEQDFLYENDSGSFTEIGHSRLLSNLVKQGSVTSVAWGDYDNDGFLDYYLGKFYYDNELYHNGGDGILEPVLDLGVNDRRDTNGFSWVDYDNDGDLDLYVVNREQENSLFRNDLNSGGLFTDVACALTVANTEIGQSGAWGDYDNDGDLDLFLANVGANNLFRNDGGESFTDVAFDAGVRQSSSGWITAMAAWADYDGDGDLDLYLATGGDEAEQPDVLFANDGDGTFSDATAAAGLPPGTSPHLSGGWGDFDGDGAPDLYMTDGWGLGNRLYQNETPDSLFIKVAVRGKGPDLGGVNLFGIGTQMRLLDAETRDLVAYRQLLPGTGPAEVIFGAPDGTYIVEVRFPENNLPVDSPIVRGGAHITIEEFIE